jgi:demethylmenaquinone methyltransferase/2-methoxy-6-polyprenyl-1,4-benzoquinol methylase
VIPITDTYSTFAPFYDLLSGEYPVYRRAARWASSCLVSNPANRFWISDAAQAQLRLLQQAIGPGGTIIGIDQSPGMLARARRKVERRGWTNVILLEADATTMSSGAISIRIAAEGGRDLSDAVLATYSLSRCGSGSRRGPP